MTATRHKEDHFPTLFGEKFCIAAESLIQFKEAEVTVPAGEVSAHGAEHFAQQTAAHTGLFLIERILEFDQITLFETAVRQG